MIYTDLLTNCLINRVWILMEMRKIVRMDFLSFSLLLSFMDREGEKFYRFYSGGKTENIFYKMLFNKIIFKGN